MGEFASRLKWAFIGGDGLRAGWRFALFVGLWFWLIQTPWGAFIVVSRLYQFSATGFTPADILVFTLANALTLLLISALLARLERHRWSWFGLALERDVLRLFGMGCLWGALAVTLLLAAASLGGGVSFNGLAVQGAD
ncbi:MAG TPA: hypothetical protein VGS99_08695, partial [Gammaproteobacteria bacterium]|nr:hypothetical protein [Gammaproteobacteria bacterium]